MKSDRAKIHFSKFEDNWEMTTLGGISIKIGDGLHGTPEYSENGDVAFINGNNLIGGKITLNSNTKFVSSNRKTQDDKELELDTILISINGTIGSLAWYKNENVMLGKSVAYIKISFADKNFVYQLLQTSKVKNYFLNSLTGSTIKNLGLKAIREAPIFIPEINEQKKIGLFFKNLDDLISLHQQELDALKQTKQGFLQKMFPKDGESVPEIRFPVFNDEWKLKKLKEIAEINPKSTLPNEFEYVDLGSVVGTRLLSSLKETKQTAPSRAQRVAKTGDVFYQTVRPYQKNNFLFDLTSDNFVFSTGYAQMRPNIDSYFLLNSLQINSFVVSVMNSCTGTSYPAINSSDLSQLEIMVPVTGEEQVKIGEFFRQLDEVIELKEQEIEALKQTKQGFLQKMFI